MRLQVILIAVGKMEEMVMGAMVVMVLMVTVDNGDTGLWMKMIAGSRHCS